MICLSFTIFFIFFYCKCSNHVLEEHNYCMNNTDNCDDENQTGSTLQPKSEDNGGELTNESDKKINDSKYIRLGFNDRYFGLSMVDQYEYYGIINLDDLHKFEEDEKK